MPYVEPNSISCAKRHADKQKRLFKLHNNLTSPPHALGKFGEARAADYLLGLGWQILARNYHTRFGELDIVALDHNTLVFVEVRARSSQTFGTPEESITSRKIARILKSAQIFTHSHNYQAESQRVDLIALTPHGLKHLKDITS